jgi:hypothetical protein
MKHGLPRDGSLRGLVVLNVALLGALAVMTFMPRADAQLRARANYTMAAGGTPGTAADVIWVVDTVNQQMIALTWEPNQRELVGIGGRSLARDAAAAGQPGVAR